MRSIRPLAIGISALFCHGCGSEVSAAERHALAAFESFQRALLAGDADQVRCLVTAESRLIVRELPWQRIRHQEPLVALSARDARGSYHVAVVDPNARGARGTYVVVREHGRYVVDLLASAAFAARAVGEHNEQVLEPRGLTPADHDRIRQHALEQR